jgi:hypothetical protein
VRIPWTEPGDIVCDVPPECPCDITLEEFVKLDTGPHAVAFTDGSVEMLSSTELIALFSEKSERSKQLSVAGE